LLGIEPEPDTSRVILALRNSTGNCLGLKAVVKSGEIVIRVILPRGKGRNRAVFLGLGPVKDVLVIRRFRHLEFRSRACVEDGKGNAMVSFRKDSPAELSYLLLDHILLPYTLQTDPAWISKWRKLSSA
jgi:hypothetical protein